MGIDEKPDLQQLACEYSKLLNKIYCFLLSDGSYIEFQIKTENFYHLLGFNKFKDIAFHKMIEDITVDFWKNTFYEAVLNGYISYESYDETKIDIPPEIKATSYLNYMAHEETTKVKEVKYRRFPYFSYNQIVQLLENELVVDFDSNESDSLIDADKIFFKHIDTVQKNLNLFIGYSEKDGFYPATFFLENKLNDFKTKKDGTLMKTLKVLCLYIEDLNNNKSVEFRINWEELSTYLENIEYSEPLRNLKKYYSSSDINEDYLKNELLVVKEKYSEVCQDAERIKNDIVKCNLILSYYKAEKIQKEEIQLALFEYDIDVEEMDCLEEAKYKQLLLEQKTNQEKGKRLNNKIHRIEEALPIIINYDISKVKKAYCHFIKGSENWENEFWKYLISDGLCLKNSIVPREVKKMYMNWIQSNK